MSKKWPIGNCEPLPYKINECDINVITKDNKIQNVFSNIPRDLLVQENFDICDEPVIIQPKMNVGPKCGNHIEQPKPQNQCWPHEWANLSPDHKGGSIRIVRKKSEKIAPVMGKIDIPNYFMPPYTQS